jgi:hypothetical protein
LTTDGGRGRLETGLERPPPGAGTPGSDLATNRNLPTQEQSMVVLYLNAAVRRVNAAECWRLPSPAFVRFVGALAPVATCR